MGLIREAASAITGGLSDAAEAKKRAHREYKRGETPGQESLDSASKIDEPSFGSTMADIGKRFIGAKRSNGKTRGY